ncbi:MAG: hypothetical protein NT051_00040 [Candidatus Micrarchaeota archaeon]|nr:hypothetical protein [Candidatus Micrarchaeota archaeon]
MNVPLSAKRQPLIIVSRLAKFREGDNWYFFHLIDAKKKPKLNGKEELVFSVKLPPMFFPLAQAFDARKCKVIGSITWNVCGNSAESAIYFPKANVGGPGTKGLGYFLEYLTARELDKMGIECLRAPANSEPARMGQLEKVGLSAGTPVGISIWKRGMIQGIKNAQKMIDALAI